MPAGKEKPTRCGGWAARKPDGRDSAFADYLVREDSVWQILWFRLEIPDQTALKKPCASTTARIYDSCSDKDCLEDLQVYFTDQAQAIVDSATGRSKQGR